MGDPALAGDGSKRPGRGTGYGLGPCVDAELNLSGEQAIKLKAIQSDYLKSVQKLQRDLAVMRGELKMCGPDDEKETNRAAQLRRTIQEHHEKIREIWLRYKIACRELLTPDQQERLDSLKGSGRYRSGIGRMVGEEAWNR